MKNLYIVKYTTLNEQDINIAFLSNKNGDLFTSEREFENFSDALSFFNQELAVVEKSESDIVTIDTFNKHLVDTLYPISDEEFNKISCTLEIMKVGINEGDNVDIDFIKSSNRLLYNDNDIFEAFYKQN